MVWVRRDANYEVTYIPFCYQLSLTRSLSILTHCQMKNNEQLLTNWGRCWCEFKFRFSGGRIFKVDKWSLSFFIAWSCICWIDTFLQLSLSWAICASRKALRWCCIGRYPVLYMIHAKMNFGQETICGHY